MNQEYEQEIGRPLFLPFSRTKQFRNLLLIVLGTFAFVGALFFGLWLIPMGWLARRSGWMPSAMGWILMVGGVGYVANAVLSYLLPMGGPALDLLTVPATIGAEGWWSHRRFPPGDESTSPPRRWRGAGWGWALASRSVWPSGLQWASALTCRE